MTRVIDPASDPLCHVVLSWRIVPYTRAPRAARRRPDVLRYQADQKQVAKALAYHWRGPRPYAEPYRVGVQVHSAPCGSGPNKGRLPGNIGDWDNSLKAVLDAMQYHGIVAGDDARYFQGPAPVAGLFSVAETQPSGWVLSHREATVITVWPATVMVQATDDAPMAREESDGD